MIDTDVFQIVALALLGITVIAALAALAVLSGVRNTLDELARTRSGASAPHAEAGPSETTGRGAAATQEAAPPARAEPAAAYEPAVSTREQAAAATGVAESAPRQAQEPEEQPFERDGRWWYRRGDELLVYEESSGQWMPAPQDAPSAAAPVSSSAETAAGSESFWKCPSCGAVNGSTATTCRMCFAARP